MAYRDEVLADSPSFYLHSGTTDESGNGGAITVNGSLPEVSSLIGDDSPARQHNGNTANYMTVADSAFLDLGDGPFTLEAWCVPYALATMEIFNKGNSAYELLFGATVIEFGQSDIGAIVDATFAPRINTLYHVVARRVSAADVTLVVNGEDKTGPISARTLVNTATALHIGRYHTALFPWNGLLDELAIYPSALGDSRILAHWAAGAHALQVGVDHGSFGAF